MSLRPRALVRAAAVAACLLTLSPAVAHASVTADPTFGNRGQITIRPECTYLDEPQLDPAGDLFVAELCGTRQITVQKVTAAGVIDETFGNAGTASIAASRADVSADCPNSCGWSIAPTATGVFATSYSETYNRHGEGTAHIAVARLTADGTVDRTFGRNGLFKLNLPGAGGASFTADPRGRLVINAPRSTSAAEIMRVTADGKLDRTFSGDGRLLVKGAYDALVTPTAGAVWITRGKQYKVSRNRVADGTAVIKLKNNGRRDAAFGRKGSVLVKHSAIGGSQTVTLDRPLLVEDGRGRANLIVGEANGRWVDWERLTRSGKIDRGFARRTTPIRGTQRNSVLTQSWGLVGGKLSMLWVRFELGGPMPVYLSQVNAAGNVTRTKCVDCRVMDPNRPHVYASDSSRSGAQTIRRMKVN
ncbi:MAG: hypothetical protein CMH83_21750 [Nocardioides sp.]|nr:hypothetical protein [Nocardioides sp.]